MALASMQLVRSDGLRTGGDSHARTKSGDVTRFSTASTTPSVAFTPMAVEPSCTTWRRRDAPQGV